MKKRPTVEVCRECLKVDPDLDLDGYTTCCNKLTTEMYADLRPARRKRQ